MAPPLLRSQGRDGTIKLWDASRLDFSPRRGGAGAAESSPAEVGAIFTGSYTFCKCATWPHRGDSGGGASGGDNGGDSGAGSQLRGLVAAPCEEARKS